MPNDKQVDKKKQQLEAEITKEAAIEKAKPRCSICGKYTDKKSSPQCFGHGGGGGGDGPSGDSAAKTEGKGLETTPEKTTDTVTQSNKYVITAQRIDLSLDLQSRLDDKPFNPEIISELLSNRMLLIDSDRELGALTIKLLCHPRDLSPEQRNEFKKFVNTIIKELEEFKKENGISTNCKVIGHDSDGNILSLRIALPSTTLYEAFIQRLASKHLLPLQNIEQKSKEKVTYQEGINLFNPTLLSTKPTPYANRKTEDDEALKDESKSGKKSSIRPKSPLDGLKR